MGIYTQKENSIRDRKVVFLPELERVKSISLMKAVYFDIIYAENLTDKNNVNYFMKTFH
jgi:hypothetical protein